MHRIEKMNNLFSPFISGYIENLTLRSMYLTDFLKNVEENYSHSQNIYSITRSLNMVIKKKVFRFIY